MDRKIVLSVDWDLDEILFVREDLSKEGALKLIEEKKHSLISEIDDFFISLIGELR
ncbi:MAG: hypothetical protein ACRCU3_01850 [Eubacteriaceae bacterium]